VFVLVEDAEDAEDAVGGSRSGGEGGGSDPGVDGLVEVEGVAGGWSFVPDPALTRSWWAMAPYRITVLWLDADPVATAAVLEPALRERWDGGAGRPVFAGPLRTIAPGAWDWFGADAAD
jgi:hypothetical protein